MLNDCQLQPTWTCIKFKPLELMPLQSANDRGSIMARPSQVRACTSPSSHRLMVLRNSILAQTDVWYEQHQFYLAAALKQSQTCLSIGTSKRSCMIALVYWTV